MFNSSVKNNGQSNQVYYYSTFEKMVNGAFITVVQKGPGVYINECRLNTSKKVVCLTKEFIKTSQIIIESVLTKKIFAYQNALGYHVISLKTKGLANNLLTIKIDLNTCSKFDNKFTLICLDKKEKNLHIFEILTEREKNKGGKLVEGSNKGV